MVKIVTTLVLFVRYGGGAGQVFWMELRTILFWAGKLSSTAIGASFLADAIVNRRGRWSIMLWSIVTGFAVVLTIVVLWLGHLGFDWYVTTHGIRFVRPS